MEKFTKYFETIINWLMKYFNWMNESNRALHIFVGMLIFDIVKLIGFADFIALAVVICAAVIKELWDNRNEIIQNWTIVWKFDWRDILATILLPIIQCILF